MHCLARPLRALASTLLLASGCPAGFVDAHPPALRHVRVNHSSSARTEPLVYGVILDLHLLSSERCAATRSAILGRLSSMLEGRAPPKPLDVIDLSPGCVQKPSRKLDLTALEADLAAAIGFFTRV